MKKYVFKIQSKNVYIIEKELAKCILPSYQESKEDDNFEDAVDESFEDADRKKNDDGYKLSKDEFSRYLNNASCLINCQNIDDLKELYEEFKPNWFSRFAKYIYQNINDCIESNVKNKSQVHNIRYNPTTNPSESINHSIKTYTGNKVLDVGELVFFLYRYPCNVINEFNRALDHLGRYELKEEFEHLREYLFIKKEFTKLPGDYLQALILESQKNEEVVKIKSQVELANWVIKWKKYDFCNNTNSFNVYNPPDSTSCAVNIENSKPICTMCSSFRRCFHVLVVEEVLKNKELIKIKNTKIDFVNEIY